MKLKQLAGKIVSEMTYGVSNGMLNSLRGSRELCKCPHQGPGSALATGAFPCIFSSADYLCVWSQHLFARHDDNITTKKSKAFCWGFIYNPTVFFC